MHRLVAVALLALGLVCLAGCGGSHSDGRQPATATRSDPQTVNALLRIARRFNSDYAANDDGPVYDRWDAPSRQTISRAQYIRRHRECPTAPGKATVHNAVRDGPWWLVHYSLSGTELTDYWRYQHGRWMFDLIRSDPQAARLYGLPAAQYLEAVGCAAHP